MAVNSVGANGITIQELTDILSEVTSGLQSIYGSAINVNPNSPDGQMIHLFSQAKLDVLEMILQVATSFDPDQATGVLLDQRCAINNLARDAGTYTRQLVTVTVSQAVTLQGLDLYPTDPYTVADSTGNQYQLVTTHVFSGADNASLVFQAATMGAVSSAQNTITVPVTVLAGVTSVNNPLAVTTVGTSEESDILFRIRRANAVALSSSGWYGSILAAVYAVSGVDQVKVFENDTGSTNGYGMLAKSIWVIVNGGTDAAVAQAIYSKRPACVGQKGSVSVNVTQQDGTTFAVLFDRPTAENLYFKATLSAITGALDKVWIAAQVLAQFGTSYAINQAADTASIIAYIKSIAPNASVSVEGVSTDGTNWYPVVTPTGVNYRFTIPDAAHIAIS